MMPPGDASLADAASAQAEADADQAGRTPARPWLPWIAFGVVVGALQPDALANATGSGWSTQLWWWAVGCPATAIGLAAARWHPLAGRWLVFAACALLGAAVGDDATRAAAGAEPRLLAVEGVVAGVQGQDLRQRFGLRPDRALVPAGAALAERIHVRADDALPGVRSGDRVAAHGRWSRNDRGDRLDAVEIALAERREDGARGWAWRALAPLGAHRALGESLILGQGDPPEKAAFRQSGLLHVLAVSGMHLAIAAALGLWLMRLVGVGWWARLAIFVALIVGYTWLTGASPATQRALVMGLAVVAYALVAREPHRLAAVSLAALALVLWEPGNAHDIGFQLSLAAVLGIVTLGMDLVRLRQRALPLAAWPLDRPAWRAWLFACRVGCDGLLIGLAASLATAPLVAWHFNGVCNPWGPLATLVATPPTTLALWLGLPLVMLAGVSPGGPWEGLYAGLDGCLAGLAASAEWAAALPGATCHPGSPPAAALLLWPFLFAPLRDRWDVACRIAAVALVLAWWMG